MVEKKMINNLSSSSSGYAHKKSNTLIHRKSLNTIMFPLLKYKYKQFQSQFSAKITILNNDYSMSTRSVIFLNEYTRTASQAKPNVYYKNLLALYGLC